MAMRLKVGILGWLRTGDAVLRVATMRPFRKGYEDVCLKGRYVAVCYLSEIQRVCEGAGVGEWLAVAPICRVFRDGVATHRWKCPGTATARHNG